MNEEALEVLAERVADLLAERLAGVALPGAAQELIDPIEAARRLGVSRDFVYEHREELGVIRLGDGPRARLRFDPRRVAAFDIPAAAPPRRVRQRPPRRAQRSDLLPIAGERER